MKTLTELMYEEMERRKKEERVNLKPKNYGKICNQNTRREVR